MQPGNLAEDDFGAVIFSATLTPYRSLGRRGFLVMMTAIGAHCALTGLYVWWLGAWPVLGFLGLDFLAIGLAFWFNFRAARAFEEVQVSRSEVVVRRVDARGRRHEMRFNPQWVRLEVQKIEHEGVARIALRMRERRVPVGTFLNPDDRTSFARAFGAALAQARR